MDNSSSTQALALTMRFSRASFLPFCGPGQRSGSRWPTCARSSPLGQAAARRRAWGPSDESLFAKEVAKERSQDLSVSPSLAAAASTQPQAVAALRGLAVCPDTAGIRARRPHLVNHVDDRRHGADLLIVQGVLLQGKQVHESGYSALQHNKHRLLQLTKYTQALSPA